MKLTKERHLAEDCLQRAVSKAVDAGLIPKADLAATEPFQVGDLVQHFEIPELWGVVQSIVPVERKVTYKAPGSPAFVASETRLRRVKPEGGKP